MRSASDLPSDSLRAPQRSRPAPRAVARAGSTLLVLALATGFAAPARADRVLTKDGRALTVKKAREQDGGYHIIFENGAVTLRDKALVQSVEIEGDMADYVPANDDERQKLADGYVRYRGRWLTKAGYEFELQRQFEASKKRTDELAKHSDWSNAYEKESAHFRIKTDTTPELLAYYAELLEAYYNLMDTRIGIDPPPSLKRTQMVVNIYKSHAEFHALANPGNPAVLGFFSPMDQTLNFYHDYAEPPRSTWVALHECTHLLTFLIDPQYVPQIWLNEAVADYFGSSKVTRDKKGKIVIEPGELQTDRVLTVQQALRNASAKTGENAPSSGAKSTLATRKFTPLEDLFKLSRDAFDGFQYAHAWSFVYFLNNYEKHKYQKPFDRFFKGLYTLEKPLKYEVVSMGEVKGTGGTGKRVSPEDIRTYLLKKLSLKDTKTLEEEWKAFIAAVPITGPEARLKRGLYGMRMGEFDQALEDLTAAIDAGSKDPRGFAARGKCVAFKGQPQDGVEDMKRAIELDPLDAKFRYDLSAMLCGRVSTGAVKGAGAAPASDSSEEKFDNAEARALAGMAQELDPENELYKQWYARFQ